MSFVSTQVTVRKNEHQSSFVGFNKITLWYMQLCVLCFLDLSFNQPLFKSMGFACLFSGLSKGNSWIVENLLYFFNFFTCKKQFLFFIFYFLFFVFCFLFLFLFLFFFNTSTYSFEFKSLVFEEEKQENASKKSQSE